MAKSKKPSFYKLGKTAASFYDPVVKLKISGSGMGKLTVPPTRRIQNAVRHNHLVEVQEAEYNKWLESKGEEKAQLAENSSSKIDLTKMDGKSLSKYYKESYEVTEDDIKKFDKLSVKEKIAFLTEDDDDE